MYTYVYRMCTHILILLVQQYCTLRSVSLLPVGCAPSRGLAIPYTYHACALRGCAHNAQEVAGGVRGREQRHYFPGPTSASVSSQCHPCVASSFGMRGTIHSTQAGCRRRGQWSAGSKRLTQSTAELTRVSAVSGLRVWAWVCALVVQRECIGAAALHGAWNESSACTGAAVVESHTVYCGTPDTPPEQVVQISSLANNWGHNKSLQSERTLKLLDNDEPADLSAEDLRGEAKTLESEEHLFANSPTVMRGALQIPEDVYNVWGAVHDESEYSWQIYNVGYELQVKPPRCFTGDVSRHALESASNLRDSDVNLIEQLSAQLPGQSVGAWRQVLCVGDVSSSTHSAGVGYSAFAPLQGSATWKGHRSGTDGHDDDGHNNEVDTIRAEYQLQPGDVVIAPPSWHWSQTSSGESLVWR